MTLREELSHGVLANVADDEPIFVLRAKDIIAPGIVQAWKTAAQAKGVPAEKTREAERCRLQMLGWQAKYSAKMPD